MKLLHCSPVITQPAPMCLVLSDFHWQNLIGTSAWAGGSESEAIPQRRSLLELAGPAGIPGRSRGRGNRAWPAEGSAEQSPEVRGDSSGTEEDTQGHTRAKATLCCPSEELISQQISRSFWTTQFNHNLIEKFQSFHFRKFYPDLFAS